MKFILIFGPQAVGKMTVGDALSKKTGFKLFHNHMTIEPLLKLFPFESPQFQTLNNEFRIRIFEEVANSDLIGLIFTFVWNLNDPKDCNLIQAIKSHYESKGHRVCFVELFAPLEERLMRNETEFRLSEKPSKRDVIASKNRILDSNETARMTSNESDVFEGDYIKIDNTDLLPDDVAKMIEEKFDL